jgi:hypothetical protein
MTPYYPARDGYPSTFDLLKGTSARRSDKPARAP